MRRLPKPCVLDACVGIKLFLEEQHSPEVERLVEAAVQDKGGSLFVPDLFFVECANVLWKRVRRGEFPESTALKYLAHLHGLALPATPTSDLMERALQLACQCGISAYDGCYAALAEQLGIPLLTADERLVGLLANTGVKVVSLCA